MKIADIFKENKTVFSLEIFPPKKAASVDVIYETLDGLKGISPDFISVTYGAGGNRADMKTCEICSIIKNKYNITPMSHLTCVNSSKDDIDYIAQKLAENGIENILALRGDINPDIPPKNDFKYASELTKYLKEKTNMGISGACYPEVHSECESMQKDIENLRIKVDNGCEHLISQLFFDNDAFFDYIEKVRAAGINVPIEAGIMPVTNKSQIERMVAMCGASIPQKLAKIINRYGDDQTAMLDAGIAYAVSQIIELIASGVDGIHLYTMNNPYVANKIYDAVSSIRRASK